MSQAKNIQTFFYFINIQGVKVPEETTRERWPELGQKSVLGNFKNFVGNKQRVRSYATAIYVWKKQYKELPRMQQISIGDTRTHNII